MSSIKYVLGTSEQNDSGKLTEEWFNQSNGAKIIDGLEKSRDAISEIYCGIS